MKIKKLNHQGDTILEVLICIAVLALIVAAAYTLTSRNQLTTLQAQERSEALKVANTQIELLRAYAEDNSVEDLKDLYFCMTSGTAKTDLPTAPQVDVTADGTTPYPGTCQTGTDNRYKIAVWGYNKADDINADTTDKAVFGVTVRWDSVKGGAREEVKTFYTTYDTDANGSPTGFPNSPAGPVSCIRAGVAACSVSLTIPAGSGTTISWSTGANATKCEGTNFPGGSPTLTFDPRPALTGNFLTNALFPPGRTYTITCYNGLNIAGNTTSVTVNAVAPPPSSVVITGSGDYPAWHMYFDGSGITRQFTVTNPISSPSPINITDTPITGNTSSFSIVGFNACEYTTLAVGASCIINVRFDPPSGPANNRLSNAGRKSATLTVNNSSGAGATTKALTGWAVTDRMGPGDQFFVTGDDNVNAASGLRGFDPACYNDAFACSSLLVLWSNGNLVLYPNASNGIATWMTGASGGAYTEMQAGNGIFGLYTSAGAGVWGTNGAYPGVWLQIFNDGQLWRMQPSWNSSVSGYERIWP